MTDSEKVTLIVYGYATTYKHFMELKEAANTITLNKQTTWIMSDDDADFAVFGKVLSTSGNESEVKVLPTLSSLEKADVEIEVLKALPGEAHKHCKYYVVTL